VFDDLTLNGGPDLKERMRWNVSLVRKALARVAKT